jgi:long-chain acyl-CoA synthetase
LSPGDSRRRSLLDVTAANDAAIASLADVLRATVARDPAGVLFQRRGLGGFEDVAAKVFADQVNELAKGFVAAGVRPGDRVGIMSKTRYEWTQLDFALWTAGAVPVPIYETSSVDQLAWILADSAAVGCIVENRGHAARLARVRDRLPELRHTWQIEPGDLPGLDDLASSGHGVADAELDARVTALHRDTPATLIYTSGTTGRPKGCVLTHGNFLDECSSAIAMLPELFEREDASTLLFLPLAHVFGRMIQVAVVMQGVTLAHSDPARLVKDLAQVRPTFVLSVPQVFEKIYETARRKAAADGKARIFEAAAATAIAWSRATEKGRAGVLLAARHAVFERLVYRKLRAAFGGRADWAVSGGAALGQRLGHFFRGVGVTVLEGYGLTESCAATAFNPWDRQKIGTVGQPLPGSVIRIADDGEVLLHGEHLFTEYWNNPGASEEALADGWFHTGDIGTLDEDGYLRITGRKKEILVTAGGKNVAPAVIEDRIRAHALVAECMVVGDGRPFVGALVTVDEEFLGRWAAEHGKPAGVTAAELRDDPDLNAAIQSAIDDGNAAVSKAESVRKFRILGSQFTEESGHLTPSLKLKRNVVARDYASEIEAIYAK